VTTTAVPSGTMMSDLVAVTFVIFVTFVVTTLTLPRI
jgi:hypothetical protein